MAEAAGSPQPSAAPPPPSSSDIESGKVLAILCYIPIFFVGLIVAIICLVQKNNEFALYHAKQALTLMIAAAVLSVLWCVPFLNAALGIVILVLFILGLVNAIQGKYAPIPLVGQFAEKMFGSVKVEKR